MAQAEQFEILICGSGAGRNIRAQHQNVMARVAKLPASAVLRTHTTDVPISEPCANDPSTD